MSDRRACQTGIQTIPSRRTFRQTSRHPDSHSGRRLDMQAFRRHSAGIPQTFTRPERHEDAMTDTTLKTNTQEFGQALRCPCARLPACTQGNQTFKAKYSDGLRCLPVCLSVRLSSLSACLSALGRSVCLPVCLSVFLSVCLYVCIMHVSVCLPVSLFFWNVCLPACLPAYACLSPVLGPSFCLPSCLPACLHVCLSVLPVCLSICQPACLPIHLSHQKKRSIGHRVSP